MNEIPAAQFKAPALASLSPEDAVAFLVDEAARIGATDLYFSADEEDVGVSIRHLGIVQPRTTLSAEQGRRAISHLKAMAGMDLAERRHPLDGRWVRRTADGAALDLRISTMPTLYGEDLAVRILDRQAQFRTLDGLGLVRQQLNQLVAMLNSPSGLILFTGPTGSGKTTTQYACLQHLNDGAKRIQTIEDPVEYAINGIRQSQVNARFGIDFPELLRGALRQSPDVIMIGEIRDPLTAETAVRAANSGHLVCATLHAPRAAGAIESMLALGVQPHFLSTSLLGVATQRLVRVLCGECKVSVDLGPVKPPFEDVRRWLEPHEGDLIFASTGCEACHRAGYTGRTGIFELFQITPRLRSLVAEARPALEIAQQALEENLLDIRRAALIKVAQGVTTFEELLRVVPGEILGVNA